MPIAVNTIINQFQSALDANNSATGGSDYYMFTQDFQPAINYAIERIIEFVEEELGGNKFAETAMRELIQLQVWQTNHWSRVNILDSVWNVNDVYVYPGVYPNTTIVPVQAQMNVVTTTADPFLPGMVVTGGTSGATATVLQIIGTTFYFGSITGVFISGETITASTSSGTISLIYLNPQWASLYRYELFARVEEPTESCVRVNADETAETKRNPFAPGYLSEDNPIKVWSYKLMTNYSATTNYVLTNPREVEISPFLDTKLVALELVNNPTKVVSPNDVIQFPEKMTNLIVNLGLLWLAIKQGDGTSIKSMSLEDIKSELLNFI